MIVRVVVMRVVEPVRATVVMGVQMNPMTVVLVRLQDPAGEGVEAEDRQNRQHHHPPGPA